MRAEVKMQGLVREQEEELVTSQESCVHVGCEHRARVL